MGFAYLGELAGLGTAVCWTVTSMSFEAAGKRIGSLAVNLIRLVMALLLLALVNWARRGLIWPLDASGHAWLWLSVSGVVGFAVGDLCLFRAFVLIGARLSMLLLSLVPLITALGSWLIIGERLEWLEWLGMALTLIGVAWVVLERRPDPAGRGRRPPLRGVLLGLGGAAGQALGLVLSKYGMGDYDALAANQIRVFSGMLAYGLLFCVIGWWSRVGQALRHPSGMGFTALGAFFGPFLGVSLSLLAVQHTEAGVAATLMALVPVIILAPARLIQRERISPRAVGGALLAVAGSALLFLT
jgi:drug/metabolite transporter (DMT)-like permease